MRLHSKTRIAPTVLTFGLSGVLFMACEELVPAPPPETAGLSSAHEHASHTLRSLDFELPRGCFHRSFVQPFDGSAPLIEAFALPRDDIDASTIAAFVDGATVSHAFDAASNEVRLASAGRERSNVDVIFCLVGRETEPGPGEETDPQPDPQPSATPTPELTASPSPQPSATPSPKPTPTPTPKLNIENVKTLIKFSLKGATAELQCSRGRRIVDHGYSGSKEKCEFDIKGAKAVVKCTAKPGTCLNQKPTVYSGRSSSGTCDAKAWIECK